MTTINALAYESLSQWEKDVLSRIGGCATLEDVAQRSVSVLYEAFKESVVLARFYAVVPYGKLPADARTFVTNLIASKGAKASPVDKTPVLSLLGSRGDKPEWNSRRASQGHLAIPLVSAEFVDEIPMVSRLLKDLGVPLAWLESGTGIETNTFGKLGGLFYVEDAGSAVDSKGRKIISAQPFVNESGIKTVFGTAGLYFLSMTFITVIVFCRETVPQATAKQFMPLANMITAATTDLLNRGAIFNAK